MTRDLENRIGHRFTQISLLEEALTHSSKSGKKDSYERMEFLGDRVLSLVIAEQLFQKFPDENEGDLAKRHSMLVKQEALELIAEQVGMAEFMHYKQHSPSKSMLADAVESVIAAIYLDAGFNVARHFIVKYWAPLMQDTAQPPEDPKSALQEWAQSQALALPVYNVIERSGPDHSPIFTVEVSLAGFDPKQGVGSSKQIAEKQAAIQLLTIIRETHDGK